MTLEQAFGNYDKILADKKIKDEYIKRTGDKRYAENLLSNATLAHLVLAIDLRNDEMIDRLIGGDSLVRETLFEAISEYLNIPYDAIYYLYDDDYNKLMEILETIKLN